MKIIIEMETDNHAFEGCNRNHEVMRILKRMIARIEAGEDGGKLMDINGNAVGKFEVIE